MKMYKKVIAILLGTAVIFTLAGCSNNSDKETTASDTKAETEAVDETDANAAETEADEAETKAAAVSGEALEINTTDDITITFSWWGGDSRHEATLAAIAAFEEKYPNIKIESTYGAWSNGDWETKMSAQYAAGTSADVSQINWNWIEAYSSTGQVFADLNDYAGIIDLSQFSETSLEDSTVAGKLQGVPISMTGRIFYWDKTTFEEAGIDVPKTLADLRAAGTTFKEVLGEDYYPLAMNEYDRMIFMVFYLESVYGKDWVEDGQLQYSEEEIIEGLEFIQSLEEDHVIPTIKKLAGDGADSIDKNSNWTDGKYAGIFEWDSAAPKYEDALGDGREFVVGDEFADMGEYQGGYSKISMEFSIAETAKNPVECAAFIEFLLNDEEAIKILGSERGIPASEKALEICQTENLLDEKVAEANAKVMDWVSYSMDSLFEASALKSSDGVYYDVMAGISYGDYSIEDGASVLIDGINEVLGN